MDKDYSLRTKERLGARGARAATHRYWNIDAEQHFVGRLAAQVGFLACFSAVATPRAAGRSHDLCPPPLDWCGLKAQRWPTLLLAPINLCATELSCGRRKAPPGASGLRLSFLLLSPDGRTLPLARAWARSLSSRRTDGERQSMLGSAHEKGEESCSPSPASTCAVAAVPNVLAQPHALGVDCARQRTRGEPAPRGKGAPGVVRPLPSPRLPATAKQACGRTNTRPPASHMNRD